MEAGNDNATTLTDDHPRQLIPQLCRLFYQLGWLTGTGGAMSIKHGGQIYVTPSGVQKERIHSDDLFVCNSDGDIVTHALNPELRMSQCAPVFMAGYKMRQAGAVIHTHAKSAVMVTLLYPGKEFRITHMQLIKGIAIGTTGKNHSYDDMLVVPIIENAPREADLIDRMVQAMKEYPDTCAVLVRRHGLYVWGTTWQQAKIMCECLDYLFDTAVEMKKCGLDPTTIPTVN